VAACFFLSALGWSMLAMRPGAGSARATADERGFVAMLGEFAGLHRTLSVIFFLGLALLFATLGACGWLRSCGLGVVTSAIAVAAGVGGLAIIRFFIL
jgi:hypothetical protein